MLATAYQTVTEAISNKQDGEWVVSIRGVEGFVVVTTDESDRLERSGQISAFWMRHGSGRVVSVPVGDEPA